MECPKCKKKHEGFSITSWDVFDDYIEVWLECDVCGATFFSRIEPSDMCEYE